MQARAQARATRVCGFFAIGLVRPESVHHRIVLTVPYSTFALVWQIGLGTSAVLRALGLQAWAAADDRRRSSVPEDDELLVSGDNAPAVLAPHRVTEDPVRGARRSVWPGVVAIARGTHPASISTALARSFALGTM